MENYCWECQGYGDDYYEENGEMVCACDTCPYAEEEYEEEEKMYIIKKGDFVLYECDYSCAYVDGKAEVMHLRSYEMKKTSAYVIRDWNIAKEIASRIGAEVVEI